MFKRGRPSLSDKPSKKITFRLSDSELLKLDLHAKKNNLSRSELLRNIVKDCIEE